MLAVPRHLRFIFYERDHLVPRKVRSPLMPNRRTECLRTRVKRPQGWLTFISIPTLNGSLCRLLYNRVSECRPFYFDSRNALGGDESERSTPPSTTRPRTVGTWRWFCQRSPCTFSTLVLCPEEGKMKLLCFAAHRFAAELLCTLNAFCRIPSAFLFKNSSILDARNFRQKTLKKCRRV